MELKQSIPYNIVWIGDKSLSDLKAWDNEFYAFFFSSSPIWYFKTDSMHQLRFLRLLSRRQICTKFCLIRLFVYDS
jgi:hypothetical protein